MGISEQIEKYLEEFHNCIKKEYEHREDYNKTQAELNVLMARHIDKSSASFENKIQLLMKNPDVQKRAEELNNLYFASEVYFKKYRDLSEYWRLKVIELQSQRKHEGSGL